MARDIQLTLIGKPGCHLCDDAREVVQAVMAEFEKDASRNVALDEQSILDDEALRNRYAEEIPVLLIDGEVHDYWRVDPVRLKTAICAKA
ncbi:glutaredoxin family protein [Agromyces sp. H3Y2-19a]|uniref:glutaredoxin family protein n=1 Tax=Agromyces TaxID=33877 RepID=UPI001E4476A2|nr:MULTISPECIES: glutaredoxin family protein [Agromyces]MCD5344996.1 glutaredoxin family protein [Agromyces sp. S2-1-8]MDF0513823.1 glutaredoxin family protein [Agromyces chromiiresistens]